MSFDYKDADVNTLQFRLADLRQSALEGLEMIIPADATATPEQRAEMLFIRDGQNYSQAPSYIPADMDAFTYDASSGQTTIK